jgi:hypothetical protein
VHAMQCMGQWHCYPTGFVLHAHFRCLIFLHRIIIVSVCPIVYRQVRSTGDDKFIAVYTR